MQIMKYFYKIFAVLSLFFAILGIFTLNIILVLLCGGAAWYLWRLSQEEQISKDGIPKPVHEPHLCGKQLKNENNEICSNSDVNTESPSTPGKMRNPFLAVILSFFFCGWGQWYNGKTREGLKFFGAALIIITLMFIFLKFGITFWVLVLPILFFVFLAIWVYGMSDAKEISDKINNKEVSFSSKSRLFWLPFISILVIILWGCVGIISNYNIDRLFYPANPANFSDSSFMNWPIFLLIFQPQSYIPGEIVPAYIIIPCFLIFISSGILIYIFFKSQKNEKKTTLMRTFRFVLSVLFIIVLASSCYSLIFETARVNKEADVAAVHLILKSETYPYYPYYMDREYAYNSFFSPQFYPGYPISCSSNECMQRQIERDYLMQQYVQQLNRRGF